MRIQKDCFLWSPVLPTALMPFRDGILLVYCWGVMFQSIWNSILYETVRSCPTCLIWNVGQDPDLLLSWRVSKIFFVGNFKFVHAAYGLMIVPWMQPRSKNCNFQLSCPTRLVENIGQAPPGSGSATDMVGLQDFLKIVSIFCMPPTV